MTAEYGDKDVEIAAEAAFWCEYRSEGEDWATLTEDEKDSYRNVAHEVLANLVASGWRRPASLDVPAGRSATTSTRATDNRPAGAPIEYEPAVRLVDQEVEGVG